MCVCVYFQKACFACACAVVVGQANNALFFVRKKRKNNCCTTSSTHDRCKQRAQTNKTGQLKPTASCLVLCVVLVADLSPITHLGVGARLNRLQQNVNLCARSAFFLRSTRIEPKFSANTHTQIQPLTKRDNNNNNKKYLHKFNL